LRKKWSTHGGGGEGADFVKDAGADAIDNVEELALLRTAALQKVSTKCSINPCLARTCGSRNLGALYAAFSPLITVPYTKSERKVRNNRVRIKAVVIVMKKSEVYSSKTGSA